MPSGVQPQEAIKVEFAAACLDDRPGVSVRSLAMPAWPAQWGGDGRGVRPGRPTRPLCGARAVGVYVRAGS
ncbi:hypothetical protein GCM10010495_77110 [Kitasatospora herbaricolor]|nr:hypothetical protein GCM10010495_77110 [Kitasatospora herbaricolor]